MTWRLSFDNWKRTQTSCHKYIPMLWNETVAFLQYLNHEICEGDFQKY